MRVFIAGIMQGSRLDHLISNQNYRVLLAQTLKEYIDDVVIVDPWVIHPNSVDYDNEQAVATFLEMTALAGEVDVVLAHLPHASMGTAIELWTAYHADIPIIVASPLTHNWVLKVTATRILPDLDSLLDFIKKGELTPLLSERSGHL